MDKKDIPQCFLADELLRTIAELEQSQTEKWKEIARRHHEAFVLSDLELRRWHMASRELQKLLSFNHTANTSTMRHRAEDSM